MAAAFMLSACGQPPDDSGARAGFTIEGETAPSTRAAPSRSERPTPSPTPSPSPTPTPTADVETAANPTTGNNNPPAYNPPAYNPPANNPPANNPPPVSNPPVIIPVTPTPDPGPVAQDNHWNLTAVYNTYEWIDFEVFTNDFDQGGPTFSDGSPFQTASVTNGTYGTVEATPVVCPNGTMWCLRYRATHYGPYTDAFTYTIVDAGGNTDTATVTIVMPAP